MLIKLDKLSGLNEEKKSKDDWESKKKNFYDFYLSFGKLVIK